MPYLVTFPDTHPEFPGQLVVIRISGDDPDGSKLAKNIFGLGIDLMVDDDFPQAVRDRVGGGVSSGGSESLIFFKATDNS